MTLRVRCKTCNRTFENANNLFQHKLTHRQANIECYGCDRMFTTYGGMFIHLEAGACSSGITLTELNRSAALCYQWKKYLDAGFRYELLDEDDSYLYDGRRDDKAFKCPTCGSWMNRLSGLFQHVESPSCEADVEEGVIERLKWWLYKRCAGLC